MHVTSAELSLMRINSTAGQILPESLLVNVILITQKSRKNVFLMR